MKKINKIKKTEFRKMLLSWQEGDLVKAGWVYDYIEKRNEAFARGWRMAIYSVINKLDEFNL
ncbi:MAG: hypothetical protein AABY22_13985 [Nanoarchaeota archaeon]